MSRAFTLALASVVFAGCEPEPVDTGIPVTHAPVLSDLEVEQENYVATLTFEASDEDGDLEGGMLQLHFHDRSGQFKIGTDALLFGSTLRVEQAFSPCDATMLVDIEARLVDATELEGNTWEDSFQLKGDVVTEYEPNDMYDYDEYTAFGFEYGRAICGTLSSTGVDSTNTYSGDADYYRVVPRVQGTWTITLRAATPSARFDLWVFDEGTQQAHYASTDTVSFDKALYPNDEFYIAVMAGEGPPGRYGITFE